jgi:hypothetical protein
MPVTVARRTVDRSCSPKDRNRKGNSIDIQLDRKGKVCLVCGLPDIQLPGESRKALPLL